MFLKPAYIHHYFDKTLPNGLKYSHILYGHSKFPFPQHHENFDGSGYPYGIKGDEIHLFGRIARIIDAYDAMTSKRSYAEAMRPFAVLAEMKNKMSGCFDEKLLREFISFLGPKDSRTKLRSADTLYSFPSVK